MSEKVFCWTKYGVESGKSEDEILLLKENERINNINNIFLWGIGNSLLNQCKYFIDNNIEKLKVVFTPMLAKPKAIDISPDSLLAWLFYKDINGIIKELPESSIVISRGHTDYSHKKKHYALLVSSKKSLLNQKIDEIIDYAQVRNFLSKKMVGFSQVTSIVSLHNSIVGKSKIYSIGMIADLISPFCVELVNGIEIKKDEVKFLIGNAKKTPQHYKETLQTLKTNLKNRYEIERQKYYLF